MHRQCVRKIKGGVTAMEVVVVEGQSARETLVSSSCVRRMGVIFSLGERKEEELY